MRFKRNIFYSRFAVYFYSIWRSNLFLFIVKVRFVFIYFEGPSGWKTIETLKQLKHFLVETFMALRRVGHPLDERAVRSNHKFERSNFKLNYFSWNIHWEAWTASFSFPSHSFHNYFTSHLLLVILPIPYKSCAMKGYSLHEIMMIHHDDQSILQCTDKCLNTTTKF